MINQRGSAGELHWSFDALGHLEHTTLPQGQRLSPLRYGSGHIHGLQWQGPDDGAVPEEVCAIERDALHRPVRRSQGALTQHLAYDARGRLIQQHSRQAAADLTSLPTAPQAGDLWRRYTYSATGQVRFIEDHLRGRQQYEHDAAGRLLSHTSVGGTHASYHFDRYAWDAADNLLQSPQDPSGTPPATATVRQSRLLSWLLLRGGHAGAAAQADQYTFEYDGHGRMVRRVRRSGHGPGERDAKEFVWDDHDRLLAVRQPHGTTRFEYDVLGRRTAKWFEPAHGQPLPEHLRHVTRFVWDGLRMVQEITEPAPPQSDQPDFSPACAPPARKQRIRSWLYDPDSHGYAPLACLDQTLSRADADDQPDARPRLSPGAWLHAHTDQLGTPHELTSPDGQICWSARYATWGQRTGSASHDHPESTDCLLRFAGQYDDSDTGLHYNTFRYYDPEVGRYISQDPIGLAGGVNLYGYVADPTSWVDPLGWCGTTAAKAIKDLDNGATSVVVKSRSEASKLFMERYFPEGYRNMTGESGPSTKNIMKWLTGEQSKNGTYHWDDLMDPKNPGRVMGHELNNPDGMLPHLQVHELEGKVIHIFFPWGS